MRHATTLRLLLLLTPLQLIATTPSWGQEERWYQIEVLFFRNLASNAQFEEQWPMRGQATPPDASYLLPAGEATPGTLQPFTASLQPGLAGEDWGEEPVATVPSPTANGAPTSGYRSVPAGERVLASANSRLNNRQDYSVISYYAWRQVLPEGAAPIYFQVTDGADFGGQYELEGFIGFSRKRYLHIETELWWSKSPTSAPDQNTLTPVAHLIENRRMRSAETHYLDHPLLGVMLHIIPLD